ncbi:hypothetical protein E2C01_028342 [Portunus trituberculatus]|uniref:Uncharacterized protein n=1 Tax=Portunus trituberculatus TaxID=210409 RepID=A0A5B7ENT8_PORTR|nr:hypothetical protein [Portunus trituberculatus]
MATLGENLHATPSRPFLDAASIVGTRLHIATGKYSILTSKSTLHRGKQFLESGSDLIPLGIDIQSETLPTCNFSRIRVNPPQHYRHALCPNE